MIQAFTSIYRISIDKLNFNLTHQDLRPNQSFCSFFSDFSDCFHFFIFSDVQIFLIMFNLAKDLGGLDSSLIH